VVRRVFVVWTHPIFHESVRLLLNHPDVELVGATSDYGAAQREILGLQPDTVLVEEPGGSLRAEVMGILEASPWSVRVIGLSLEDNSLSVYHREQRTVAQSDDLLQLVLSDPSTGGRE
jgi:DNA-binding NarL/FixJ family response regulator